MDLDVQDLIGRRDARLKEVAPNTVLREMTLVGHALETAHREWGRLSENPMRDVTKPAEPDHRERIISGPEICAMLRDLGWGRRKPVRSVALAVAHCLIAALQTGMRAGELKGLAWGDVRSDYCTLHAGRTKTGKARQVPQTAIALRNLEALRGWDGDLVFGLKSQILDAMFRKYRTGTGLEGFTFQDARHTAATRMAAARAGFAPGVGGGEHGPGADLLQLRHCRTAQCCPRRFCCASPSITSDSRNSSSLPGRGMLGSSAWCVASVL